MSRRRQRTEALMRLFHRRERVPVRQGDQMERATHFSWLRTRMSTERTFICWILIATSMIGLGFTIFELFEQISEIFDYGPPAISRIPRLFSLALIGIGTLSLIVAIREYLQRVRYLWKDEFREMAGAGERIRWSPAILLAILLLLVGVVTFGSLYLRPFSTDDNLNNNQNDETIETNYHKPAHKKPQRHKVHKDFF